MSDPKDFVAGVDSDQRRSPTGLSSLLAAHRASEGHPGRSGADVPGVLFRAALAIELLASHWSCSLCFSTLRWKELPIQRTLQTPPGAWYFRPAGTAALFPPVVAGVLARLRVEQCLGSLITARSLWQLSDWMWFVAVSRR